MPEDIPNSELPLVLTIEDELDPEEIPLDPPEGSEESLHEDLDSEGEEQS